MSPSLQYRDFKALESIVDLKPSFHVVTEKSVLRCVDPGNDMCITSAASSLGY